MKRRLTPLLALTLMVGAVGSWQVCRRASVAKAGNEVERQRRMAAGGDAAGELPGPSERTRGAERRARESETAVAKAADPLALAREYIACWGKLDLDGIDYPEGSMEADFMKRLGALDVDGLRCYLAEIESSADLTEHVKKIGVRAGVTALAQSHPQVGIVFILEHPEICGDPEKWGEDEDDRGIGHVTVYHALTLWAKDDPAAAVAWCKANADRFGNDVSYSFKDAVLGTVAKKDLKAAFDLTVTLGTPNDMETLMRVDDDPFGTMRDPTAFFTALREHGEDLKKNNDGRMLERKLSSIGDVLAERGFDQSSKWLAVARPSHEEWQDIVGGLTASLTYLTETWVKGKDGDFDGEQGGKWIRWMSETLPAGESVGLIEEIVRSWANCGREDVEKWINDCEPGAARSLAIRGYASDYWIPDHAGAMEWAMKLPEGQGREDALEVFRKMDAEAADEGHR